jgi:LytR cell envelope-related transcriptional attenuator
MSEFRDRLDAEARRVAGDPDALGRVKHRARRRRVARQVGSGVAALAVAGAGFAVALGAFRGSFVGEPAAGPNASPSATASPTFAVLSGPERMEPQLREFSDRLATAGYEIEFSLYIAGIPTPDHTVVRYKPSARRLADAVRRDLLPGVDTVARADPQPATGPPITPAPDILITLGSDYQELRNGTVQVRVLDAGAGRGATDVAADMLQGAGYDIVEVGEASSLYGRTIVACAPQHDEDGFRILEEYFPEADFLGEIGSPDHDVTVYVGPDWAGNGS